MNISGRQLAQFLGISARTVGRFERDGLLVRQRDGAFDVRSSVQGLLNYFMVRERWAFQYMRLHRLFDETQGDVFEPPRRSRHG
jgi:hypothetical protein